MLTLAIIAGFIAFLATGYLVATLLEKLSQPVYPDVQDDPRAIDILKRGQICPWPTDGECRSRESMRGVGTMRGPGVTHKTQPVISHHDTRTSSK
jgi:hypothetical protein